MNEKIGIGIITCNREDFFKILIDSLPNVDEIVIINDGKPYKDETFPDKINKIIQHKKNIGIGKSKNEALLYLLNEKCKHIFLIEDDISIKNPDIFNKYIHASEVSGIYHFNYAYHGRENRNKFGEPNPRKIITYDEDVKIGLHYNTTAALSYFRDTVLKEVGLIDSIYKNVLEHVDHTYQIIKAGFHPPFRWFADLANSDEYILELDPQQQKSVNKHSNFSFKLRNKIFRAYFHFKNDIKLDESSEFSETQLLNILDKIKNEFGKH